MEETYTLKIYSPITAELACDGGWYESYEEESLIPLDGGDLCDYLETILEAIDEEQLPDEEERGLMGYFSGSESVDRKVLSVHPTVEIYNGKLHGVAVCEVKEPLTLPELEELKDYLAGQYADGWGEGFEQRPRETSNGELYVHFWQDHNFDMKTQAEMARELRKNERKKGGEER